MNPILTEGEALALAREQGMTIWFLTPAEVERSGEHPVSVVWKSVGRSDGPNVAAAVNDLIRLAAMKNLREAINTHFDVVIEDNQSVEMAIEALRAFLWDLHNEEASQKLFGLKIVGK